MSFRIGGKINISSEFIPILIKPNEKRCLQVSVKPGAQWQDVCGTSDLDCFGVTECNYLNCGGAGMDAMDDKCRISFDRTLWNVISLGENMTWLFKF